MITLLVVDDEHAIRSLASRWARAEGYSVVEAASASEALAQIATHGAAVALCDISLPDRDGLWLAARLHEQCPERALILMSGLGPSASSSSLSSGAMGYLAKPFSRQQLMHVLEEAVEWHLERAAAACWSKATLPAMPANPELAFATGTGPGR